MEWINYATHDPDEKYIDTLFRVRVVSVVDRTNYETTAKWDGLCFMEEEEPGSWIGPLRTVTHWQLITNKST